MNIYPNPAYDYIIVEYLIPENYSNASIEFIGLDGRVQKKVSLKGKCNQAVMSTNDLYRGTFLVRLSGDNLILEVKKLIISR